MGFRSPAANIVRLQRRRASTTLSLLGEWPGAPLSSKPRPFETLHGPRSDGSAMTQSVRDIMSREPVVIHVDHSLAEAAKRMREADIGALPVVDGDELVGVITDRDLVVRAMARRAVSVAAHVWEAMTRHVVFCHEQASIGEASLVASERVRRLVVVDRDRELVSIVSLADVARVEDSRYSAAAAVREISKPTNTAKTPSKEDPTGGRARGSPAGTLHVYARRPRIRRAGGTER